MSDDYSKMFGDEHLIARLHAAVDDWFEEDEVEKDPIRSLFHELLVVGVMVWASNEVLNTAIEEFMRQPEASHPTQLYMVTGSGMGHFHVIREVQKMMGRELGLDVGDDDA